MMNTSECIALFGFTVICALLALESPTAIIAVSGIVLLYLAGKEIERLIHD